MSQFEFPDSSQQEKLKITVYHGISSGQRGGNALDKLKSIIRSKVIYPDHRGKEEETPLGDHEKLRLIVLKHALSHGIKSGKVDIDEYLERYSDDESLISDSVIKKYFNDEVFRTALQRFRYTTINIDDMIRTDVTWVDEEEDFVIRAYGQEIYLEIEEDASNLLDADKDISTKKIVGPINASKIKRIILSSKYAKEEGAIRSLLEEKGLIGIAIEVR